MLDTSLAVCFAVAIYAPIVLSLSARRVMA